jgi:hypothetical protein
MNLRPIFHRIGTNKEKIGLKEAVTFSLLDYLKDVAFSLGYLRGVYRGA